MGSERAGESLQHIAQLFDRNHSSVAGYWRKLEESSLHRDGDRSGRSRLPSGRKSQEVSQRMTRSNRSHGACRERRLRSAARSSATAARKSIGPTPPMSLPGSGRCARSRANWYRTLFIQARGALKKELLEHLRRTRAMRRSLIKRRRPRVMVVSAMLFRSVNVPLRLRTAPFRGTGKATSCAAAVTARLQRL